VTPTLTQGTTPAALAAAYLAAQTPGYVQYVFINLPHVVVPGGTETFSYPVPTGQVLVLLQPLTATTNTHKETVSVTLTDDGTTLLTDWALTLDAGVLLAAEAVVRDLVTVAYTNGSARNVTVTTNVVGVLLDATRYATEVQALAAGAYASLQQQAQTWAASVGGAST
jgi:hypothetical protein